MPDWLAALTAWLALPENGLTTLFVVSFASATLLPMGSEPALYGLLKLNPDLFWPAIVTATAGNTLGGIVDYWMGLGAKKAADKYRETHPRKRGRAHTKALEWLERFGPKALVMSWLPAVGDPLCAVAGWLRMPFWPSVGWMLLGKFLRYALYTPLLLWVF